MKLYFYSNKENKIIEYDWDENKILVDLYKNYIRFPKLNENKNISKNYLVKLVEKISNLKENIPLYNIEIRDIRIVIKNDVFYKIKNENYRFPDDFIINNIKKQVNKYSDKKLTSTQKIYYTKLKNTYLFLNYFDYKLLENSYIKMVYYGSNDVGKELTTFEKISYISFLYNSMAYYTRSEIINMGLNFGDISPDDTFYNKDKLKLLYNKIILNDFNSSILIDHLYYIYNNNCKSLIQYYTFTGSYNINYYLRDDNKIKDDLLELLIKKMWKLILNAPQLKSEKLVYRFIDDDFFLKHLKIGDIYQDNGFLSTTRNQFYDIDSDKFGYIMMKIIFKENVKGFLCVETFSLFDDEEEIILPPLAKLKLLNRDNNVNYYHTKDSSKKKIVKRYEFEYIGSLYSNKLFKNIEEKIPIFNFLKNPLKGNTLGQVISNFYEGVNKHNKFYLLINKKKVLFYCDYYDSFGVYSKYFQKKSDKGFYLYKLNENGKYDYFIEIDNKLYINYFMKYIDSNQEISDLNLINIIAYIGYGFKIKEAIINCTYINNKVMTSKKKTDEEIIQNDSAFITNHNLDIYNFLKYEKKRFINNKNINENFEYIYLSLLKNIKLEEILYVHDKDKLHYIYKNFYKLDNNIKDFYIFIVENYSYLINELENKIKKFYKNLNKQYEFTYTLQIYPYLINKKIIQNIPINNKYYNINNDEKYNDTFNNNYKEKLRSLQY